MSCLVKIRSIKDTLSANELKIADFVLKSPALIRELSSQNLAGAVGVSQSSVVKFTQKLGYRGYPDFKFALNESVLSEPDNTALHGKIVLSDNLQQVSDKLLASKIAVLNSTATLNSADLLEQAVQMLRDAHRIHISGIGASALVAKDFAYKLQKLGFCAMAENDSHVQLAGVATLGKGDLLFAISQSGNTREIVEICRQARANAAQVMTLTRYGQSPVGDHAHLQLYMATDEESARLSSILARTAQEYVIDLLFIGLTQASKTGRTLMEKSNQAVAQFYRSR